jgi:Lon protease-like protein
MIVPIFPLPNTVLFPKTLVPLYIFEERYRTMIKEVLEAEGELVIALLRVGWELNYSGNSEVHRIACLGKIENYEELEGGKYNIVVVGLHRVRLVNEIPHSPYRLAEVEKIENMAWDENAADVVSRRNHLGGLFARFTELATGGGQRAAELMPQLDFESLVNMVAATLNLPVEQKQALLEMDDVRLRCDVLIPVLQKHLEALMVVRRFEHLKPENPSLN